MWSDFLHPYTELHCHILEPPKIGYVSTLGKVSQDFALSLYNLTKSVPDPLVLGLISAKLEV